jgi:hypothetical protein
MKKSSSALAAACAVIVAPTASATTFPSLTTIYIGSGVTDDGSAAETGIATMFYCSNVSGVAAGVRFLVLGSTGTIEGQATVPSLAHGSTLTVSTHPTAAFLEAALNTGAVSGGVINIESTQSGVFCTAAMVDAGGNPPTFSMPLHLVRVNPHPGAVE